MNINCKRYADEILEKVKKLENKKSLAILTVGRDPASEVYVKGKKKDCEKCGIEVKHYRFHTDSTPGFVVKVITDLNADPEIGGIILQLPTPFDKEIEEDLVNMIALKKDVDGFRPGSPFKPCTPEGIIHILKKQYNGDLTGRDVLLIGRGKLVGEPLIDLLLAENCTVTVAHSRTKKVYKKIEEPRDILISAIDKIHEIDISYCGADTIVDAGIGYYDDRLCGNCYSDFVLNRFKITPVPGGVGLMTRAVLMAHIAKASDPTFTY